jgi:hypothetical protein
LPDLAALGDGAKTGKTLDDTFRTHLVLPAGTCTTLQPALAGAERPWVFRGRSAPSALTDRCRFTCSTNAPLLTLESESTTIEVQPQGDRFRIAILSFDRFLGLRRNPLEKGNPLVEFDLLYSCTRRHGDIPVYDGTAANPHESICPSGLLKL